MCDNGIMCDMGVTWCANTDKLTKEEQNTIMGMAKGLGSCCEKEGIDADTTKEMILITMEETAKELVRKRKK